MSSMKLTPLHEIHVAAGARMVDFGGWHMPVQYTGVIDEHNAVRSRAGLFDVSHMGEARVRGPQALDYLQYLTCNNVARLKPGRVHYNGLMLPNGAFVDDLLIYMIAEDEYLLVINAANTPKDLAWFEEHRHDFDVEVTDESAAWGQIALQGPNAERILDSLVAVDLGDLRYYAFVEAEIEGVLSIVSRTGYTGEDGFEVYAPAADTERLWSAMMDTGAPHGVIPIGLGARDTLRLEAKMALYGNDIDDSTTALEADLGWIVKFKKGEFIGRDALALQAQEGIARKLVGFEMRGRAVGRQGYRALKDGHEVGRVTSGSHAPFLKKNVGLAYLPLELCEVGTEFEVEIRRRQEPAVVVSTPFYRRER